MTNKRDNAARKLGYESQAERERIRRLFSKNGIEWKTGQRRPTNANLTRIIAGKKPRDYAREYARGTERARQRGFTTETQQKRARRAAATGKYHPSMTNAAQHPELFGFHPKTRMTEYNPADAAKSGLAVEEYTLAYYQAFLSGPERYALNRKHGSPALKRWLVYVTGAMTEAEYDDKYH